MRSLLSLRPVVTMPFTPPASLLVVLALALLLGACSTLTSGDPNRACEGVVCEEPPPTLCQDTQTLLRFDARGDCVLGACRYRSRPERCTYGCDPVLAACRTNPCLDLACAAPPPPFCDGDERVVQSAGVCDPAQPSCVIHEARERCPGGCDEGGCLPCPAPVSAARCEEGVLVLEEEIGCDEATCTCVLETTTEDCADQGATCVEDAEAETAACVEVPACVEDEDCDALPPLVCASPDALVEPVGLCDEGACTYDAVEVPCDAASFCDEASSACLGCARGEGCALARCAGEPACAFGAGFDFLPFGDEGPPGLRLSGDARWTPAAGSVRAGGAATLAFGAGGVARVSALRPFDAPAGTGPYTAHAWVTLVEGEVEATWSLVTPGGDVMASATLALEVGETREVVVMLGVAGEERVVVPQLAFVAEDAALVRVEAWSFAGPVAWPLLDEGLVGLTSPLLAEGAHALRAATDGVGEVVVDLSPWATTEDIVTEGLLLLWWGPPASEGSVPWPVERAQMPIIAAPSLGGQLLGLLRTEERCELLRWAGDEGWVALGQGSVHCGEALVARWSMSPPEAPAPADVTLHFVRWAAGSTEGYMEEASVPAEGALARVPSRPPFPRGGWLLGRLDAAAEAR